VYRKKNGEEAGEKGFLKEKICKTFRKKVIPHHLDRPFPGEA